MPQSGNEWQREMLRSGTPQSGKCSGAGNAQERDAAAGKTQERDASERERPAAGPPERERAGAGKEGLERAPQSGKWPGGRGGTPESGGGAGAERHRPAGGGEAPVGLGTPRGPPWGPGRNGPARAARRDAAWTLSPGRPESAPPWPARRTVAPHRGPRPIPAVLAAGTLHGVPRSRLTPKLRPIPPHPVPGTGLAVHIIL